jgi:hypothetical protein
MFTEVISGSPVAPQLCVGQEGSTGLWAVVQCVTFSVAVLTDAVLHFL